MKNTTLDAIMQEAQQTESQQVQSHTVAQFTLSSPTSGMSSRKIQLTGGDVLLTQQSDPESHQPL